MFHLQVTSSFLFIYFLFFYAELQKAKSKAQITSNLKEEANLCNHLGELLAKNGKKLQILNGSQICLSDFTVYLSVCTGFACFLPDSGDYQAAIEEHRQELALCEVLHDVIGCAVANRKIGECYAELGNIEAALKVKTVKTTCIQI